MPSHPRLSCKLDVRVLSSRYSVFGEVCCGLMSDAYSTRQLVPVGEVYTHRLQSSSFLWFIFRILQGNPKKELLWSLWERSPAGR